MLPTVSSVGSSSAGFTGIFYKVPRRAPSAEYAQGTQGTCFKVVAEGLLNPLNKLAILRKFSGNTLNKQNV